MIKKRKGLKANDNPLPEADESPEDRKIVFPKLALIVCIVLFALIVILSIIVKTLPE